MAKLIIHDEKCKSCGICVRECPTKAIAMSARANEKGYRVAEVDDAKCVKCGSCFYMCPDCVFELEE